MEWFDTPNGKGHVTVPIIVATAAANCSISSEHAKLAIQDGVLPSIIDYFQQLGRVGRKVRDPGSLIDCYHVLLTVGSVADLLIQISSAQSERKIQVATAEMLEMLRFFCLRDDCLHFGLQRHFQCPDQHQQHLTQPVPAPDGCDEGQPRCSVCSGEHKQTFLPVIRSGVVNVLQTSVFIEGPLNFRNLPSALLKQKQQIWTSPKASYANAEALAMQLYAANIVEVFVEKPKTKRARAVVRCRMSVLKGDDNGPDRLQSSVDSNWEHLI